MNDKLRKRAAAEKEGLSETIRRALAKELESNSDFAGIAAPYKGMFRGPTDLSMKEGYAGSDPR